MKHMPQQRFLQTLDDLVATAQANLKQSYRPGEPDWDAILTDLMTARSQWGTPCKPEHYGKVVRHPAIKLVLVLALSCAALPAMAQNYDPDVALQLRRQADELANLRMQQQQQYYETQQRQEREDYDARMRRTYPSW